MSQMGQSRRSRFGRESACPPISDMSRGCQLRSEVPLAAVSRCSKIRMQDDLFDHLVGAGEKRDWHGDPKRLGSFDVDDQFDLGGLLDRQLSWLLTLENPARIDTDLTVQVRDFTAIAH